MGNDCYLNTLYPLRFGMEGWAQCPKPDSTSVSSRLCPWPEGTEVSWGQWKAVCSLSSLISFRLITTFRRFSFFPEIIHRHPWCRSPVAGSIGIMISLAKDVSRKGQMALSLCFLYISPLRGASPLTKGSVRLWHLHMFKDLSVSDKSPFVSLMSPKRT